MKFSFPYRRFFLLVTLLFMFVKPISAEPIHSESLSLGISQTLFYPEGCELGVSAKSPLASGFALIKSPSPLPDVSPSLYSYGCKLTPLTGISFLFGSITAAGFPARAQNPVFSLYSPFYKPVPITSSPLLANSSTKNTATIALEILAHNWHLASLSTLNRNSTDVSWVLLSRTFPAFSAKDMALSLSFLGGTFTKQRKDSSSWFFSSPPTPSARIFMPAIEVLIQNSFATGSCSAFYELGSCRPLSAALRADASIKVKRFTATGGFYTAERDFLTLHGGSDPILNRMFVAPSLEFPGLLFGAFSVSWGGMLIADRVRGAQYYDHDTNSCSAGTGISAESKNTRLKLELIKKETGFEVSASAVLMECFDKNVRFETKGKIRTESASGQAFITCTPVKGVSAGAGIDSLMASLNAAPELTGLVSGTCSFNFRHLVWNTALKAEIRQDGALDSLTVTLKTGIR